MALAAWCNWPERFISKQQLTFFGEPQGSPFIFFMMHSCDWRAIATTSLIMLCINYKITAIPNQGLVSQNRLRRFA